MKRKRLIMVLVALTVLLCSCASTETEALPKTIQSQDKKVSVSVPESWSEYEAELKDNLALAIQDVESGAFAQVFWYPKVEGKELSSKDYADEAQNYYAEDVTGSATEVKLESGDAGYYFAYRKNQRDTSAEQYTINTFQGYEYFIDFSGGVVEVDIFYKYIGTPPANDKLLLLQDIAKTIRVSA